MKRSTKRKLARENPNWQLKVYEDQALLGDTGPYVTQRAALVDAKELARRRAAARGQRVVTVRTRAGRDAAYKTTDMAGQPTGFYAMPSVGGGAELRYNPKVRSLSQDERVGRIRARLVTLERRLRALGYADALAEHVKRLIRQMDYYAFRPADLAPVELEAKRTLAMHAEFFPDSAPRKNPKSSPVPYLLLWAQRNGGDLKQRAGGRVAATFSSETAASGFAAELRVYGASGVTTTRAGFWPKGPYTYTVEGMLPAQNPKRTARANHHLSPGQRAVGEVRVVKPLGMRGRADFYIVEGHRLKGLPGGAARKNGAGQNAGVMLLRTARVYGGRVESRAADYVEGYGYAVDFRGPQAAQNARAFMADVNRQGGTTRPTPIATPDRVRVWADMPLLQKNPKRRR